MLHGPNASQYTLHNKTGIICHALVKTCIYVAIDVSYGLFLKKKVNAN